MTIQIQTNKTIYSNNISKVKDTNINTFTPPIDTTPVEVVPTVSDFFDIRVTSVVATGTAFADAGQPFDAFFGYLVA